MFMALDDVFIFGTDICNDPYTNMLCYSLGLYKKKPIAIFNIFFFHLLLLLWLIPELTIKYWNINLSAVQRFINIQEIHRRKKKWKVWRQMLSPTAINNSGKMHRFNEETVTSFLWRSQNDPAIIKWEKAFTIQLIH